MKRTLYAFVKRQNLKPSNSNRRKGHLNSGRAKEAQRGAETVCGGGGNKKDSGAGGCLKGKGNHEF